MSSEHVDTTVTAESAPIGVLLWPVRNPSYRPNYTLREVRIHRDADRTWVEWEYENGNVRQFPFGEQIAARYTIELCSECAGRHPVGGAHPTIA